LPEPAGELLVEQRIEGRQEAPWTRRILQDGEVWTHGDLRTWIEGGQVRQERGEVRWERVTTAPPEALEQIASVVRSFGLLDAAPPAPSGGTITGVGTVVWTLCVDGRRSELRLEGVPAVRVPGVVELDRAVQLAVAMGLDPG
jgi:hypothetical protein